MSGLAAICSRGGRTRGSFGPRGVLPMIQQIWTLTGVVGATIALGGCVAPAPVVALPGQGKSYAQFQADDTACRGGTSPAQVAGQPAASQPGPATTSPAPTQGNVSAQTQADY